MLINVNTDNRTHPPQKLIASVEATLRYRLAPFSRRLAGIDVRVCERASKRSVGEKRCTIETRPRGLAPIAVVDEALTFEQALAGAAAKTVAALERAFAPTRPILSLTHSSSAPPGQ